MRLKGLFLPILLAGVFVFSESFGQTTVTYTSDDTFVVPAGVTSVTVEAYGAGGGGSRRSSDGGEGGGGGGGGGFSGGTIAVNGGTIDIIIGSGGNGATGGDGSDGSDGGDTSVTYGASSITAEGGDGGVVGGSPGSGGTGRAGSSSGPAISGFFFFTGGDGGNGDNSEGGAGGGGAGNMEDGSDGENASFGTPDGGNGGNNNGGDGGNGGNDGSGQDGSTYGGGGGAEGDDGGGVGGDGADGAVIITYSLPDVSNFVVSSISACSGNGAAVTVSSTSMVTGTYTVTYSISGSGNSVSSTTASMDFVSGSPGTGEFTTPSLSTAENDDLHITRITNSSNNYVDITDDTNFDVIDCRVWYSYETGDFDDPFTWTLDPSGTTYDNGLSDTPENGDDIVILNGFTVAVNVDNLILTSTTIEDGAIIDMATSTLNNLGTITGEGLLRIQGVELPLGTYTDFVSTLGGTIEYYDTEGVLPAGQTEYNNLKLTNSGDSNADIVFTTTNDLTVNGIFTISSISDGGTTTWQINDNSDTQRTIILNGDLNVAENGRITVGTGNETSTGQHDLFMYGNIINEGIIKFYDPLDSEFINHNYGISNVNDASNVHTTGLKGNAVVTTFSGNTNETVTCNGITDFYRFVVDKGTGQQAIVTVDSDDTGNFRLFGPSNIETDEGPASNEQISSNALSIVNGTLELTGSIDIPNLCVGTGYADYFPIPTTGVLWLNGDDVTIQLSDLREATNKDCRILMSGLLRVSAGTLNGGFSKGLGSQGGGAYLQEGGEVNIWQFRPRQLGGDIIFSFNQTGGTLNVGYGYALAGGTIDIYTEDYHRFDLSLASSTFQMSGNAILNLGKPTGTSNGGLFSVLSATGNYNVTGGTVNLYLGDEDDNSTSHEGYVDTTVPLYNVNIYEEAVNSNDENVELESNLIVLNDLTINTGNNPSFITNNFDVTVGGDFTINSGTTYTPGNGTTTFDGTGARVWTQDGTITSLSAVVMDKAGGSLALAGGGTFPDISTALTLTSGTLADGGNTLTVSGTGSLTNNATHTGSGLILYSSTTGTIDGSNGTFGNLTITSNATIATAGKQTITGDLRLTSPNTKLNIGSNELVVLGGIYSSGGTVAQAYTSNDTFVVPTGVSSITVEVYGAGGGGGAQSDDGGDGGGGGGGGGFRGGDISVSASDNVAIIVGTGGNGATSQGANGSNGNASSVTHTSGTITANGGGGGISDNSNSADGGTGGGGSYSGSVTNQISFDGGDGGDGDTNEGGGGGGAGGPVSIGENGDNGNDGTHNGGSGGGGSAGSGGSGGDDGAGSDGQNYGGGGGAAGDDSNNGGDGANGYVIITYTTSGNAEDFDANKMIVTNGLHNAGGLTRQGASGDILFPVGSGSIYTPNTINVAATSHGTISVRPVSGEHPVATSTGESLEYYWRVTSLGYEGITDAEHKNYTYSTTTEGNPTANYLTARYDPTTYEWATSSTNFTPGTAIPDFNTDDGTWSPAIGDQLDGEYTCGNIAAFGSVTAYFSRQDGNWNDDTTWSTDKVAQNTGTVATSNPTDCSYCPVVIGDGIDDHHRVTTVANSTCGTLSINTGSTLDCSTFTGHNFGTGTGGVVEGRGTLSIGSNEFPGGDFTNFIGSSGGTVEWYGATKTIPSTGDEPPNLNLTSYYNLVLNPSSGQTITLPGNDLTIYNDWTQGSLTDGDVSTNGTRTIDITGNLTINDGTFDLVSGTTLVVGGNSTIGSDAIWTASSGVSTLSTPGGVINNGTITFGGGNLNITFTGTSDASFTGTGSGGTTLSEIIIDKGTSQTPTLTFDVGGTVTTTEASGGWLTITNGTFDWATSNTTILSTDSYIINPTARLKVSNGTVNTTDGDNDGYDLFLNGALEVSGGILNVGNTTVNGNNVDLEYGSAGNPEIIVSSGTMWVKGSVRRSDATITGALSYTQTDGTVTIGGISSTEVNDRGVFEIDGNPGSNFTLSGTGTLEIQRQNGGADLDFADVYINPETSNVSSTSTINIGLSTESSNTNFRINIAPSIGNLSIAGTNAHTVNMFSNQLVVGGDLTIPSGSTLNTNSLDVSVGGDFDGTGTYTGGTNVTTFNGTGPHSAILSASSSFNDVTISKTVGTTLSLSGTSPSLQNLNILSGTLDVGSFDLEVNKNIVNNSSQTGSGSILVNSANGVSNTISGTSGLFTNLTLGGSASTKTINVKGDMTINGDLNFTVDNRYLMMKSNRLTFGESATITGASSSRFIRTNGVTSDLGVTKIWGTGSSTFTYEVGTSTNYTPASYTLGVTTGGELNVIPVNSVHLTYNQASAEQVLDYNWIVTRDDDLDFNTTGSHSYTYPSALLFGTGGNLEAGYLDINGDPLGWETTGHGGSASSTVMTFTNMLDSNLPSMGNTFDYSVGTSKDESDGEDDDETLPNPILPLYSRISQPNVANTSVGGTWISATNWTFDSSGDPSGLSPSAFVPKGIPVVILSGSRINISDVLARGRKAFKTTIDGILDVGTITGHNLGIIDGTGVMTLETNTIPAGNYSNFTSIGGGTIEYAATMTMNSLDTYNNLTISEGSGATVTMTASDLTVNGTVTIPSGTTLENSTNNADITVEGTWDNSGTYNAGLGTTTTNGQLDNSGTYNVSSGTTITKGLLTNTGTINGDDGDLTIQGNWDNTGGTFDEDNGTVTFSGSNAQTTIGSLTFNNLTMDKSSSSYTPSNAITVNGALTLTSGNIISSAYPAASLLLLGASATSSGGSSSSFVGGQVQKVMNSGTDFTFPTGYNAMSRYQPVAIENTSATDTWTVSYVGANPGTNGYSIASFDEDNLEKVSAFEYWEVSRSSGTTSADMTLSYDAGSYYSGGDIGILSDLKVVHWDGAQWVVASGSSTSQSGDKASGSFTVLGQTDFSPQTFGSSDPDSGLPVTWLSFEGYRVADGVDLTWKTATEINNDYFEVERSLDGVSFEVMGSRKGAGNSNDINSYEFMDLEANVFTLYYYRIRQVDYDGTYAYSKTILVEPVKSSLRWKIFPNPVESGMHLSLVQLGASSNQSDLLSILVHSSDGRLLLNASGSVENLNWVLNNAIDKNSGALFLIQIIDGISTETIKVIRK